MYFDVTMQFTSIVDGKTKKQKAKFLIQTETFGDSEQKAFAELGDNERDAVCCSISRSKVTEVIKVGDGEHWFKVNYSCTISDDNGKEKTAKFLLLIDADNIGDATDRARDYLAAHWSDAVIFKVENGKYADVLQYDKATATMKPKAVTASTAYAEFEATEMSSLKPDPKDIFKPLQNFIDNEKAIQNQ